MPFAAPGLQSPLGRFTAYAHGRSGRSRSLQLPGVSNPGSSQPARFSNSGLFLRGSHFAFSRMRDRKDPAHILGECLAKALGVGRHWTPLVPLNGISLSNRLASVRYADDSQFVAIRSQERRNDRDPLPSLREREQCVRRAALEQNIGLDVCETASCVKQPPN